MKKPNYFLPKNRYLELKYYATQYKYWEKVRDNEQSLPADRANANIAIYKVSNAILAVNCDFNSDILFDCVTNSLTFKRLTEKYGAEMPDKEVFYDAYRKFFYFLSKMKGIG